MSVNYTSLALPGLSGYDFSSIVETMVQNYSLPLDKMQTKQTTLETKQDAWRDINTRLSALDNTLTTLRDSTTWSATAASSSNTDILSVSSSAGTVKGSYNVKVIQTALAQTAVSDVIAVEDGDTATSVPAGTIGITIDGETTNVGIDAEASFDDIAEAINNADAGISASVIKVNGGYRLALLSKDTGTEKAAVFSDVSGNVLEHFGVIDGVGTLNVSQEAQDAELEINGIGSVTSSSNIVTSVIPGLTFTLNEQASTTNVVVNVAADNSAAQTAVQSFVDQYNSVMSFIDSKVTYDSDTEIKGSLYADPILQGIQSRLRGMIGGSMNNPGDNYSILADVGIATSSDSYGKSALLEFDTADFIEAMAEDPDSVANLFGASAGGVTPVTVSSSSLSVEGLTNILHQYLNPMVMYDGTLDQTEDSYDRQITQIKEDIEDFNDKIAAYSERIRLKFATLETQLAALDTQSEWIDSQVASMNSSDDS